MNAIMNKTSTGKLLVAVLAMAMIVAGAAVVFSDSEVNAVAPTEDPFDGMYDESKASYAAGVFNVTDNVTITLTENIGSATAPLDMYFNISTGKTLTITGNYSVYIMNVVSNTTDAFVVVGGTLALSGGVDAHFTTQKNVDIEVNNHVFNGASLVMTGGSTLTMTQTGEYSSGIAFYNSNDASITATESKIILDNTGGVAAKMTLTDSEIQVVNPKAGNAFINLETDSELTGSTVTIPNQDFSDKSGMNLYIKSETTIEDSELNLGNSYLVMVPGTTLNAEGTTINAEAVALRDGTANTQDSAMTTINGAIINADLGVAYPSQSGTAATKANYTLNSVTLQTVTAASGVALKSTTGVVVTGNLSAADANVDGNTQIIVSSGARASLPAGTNVYVASGANVTVDGQAVAYDADNVITIAAGEVDKLVAAASVEGANIQINGAITLTDQDLVIGNGTDVKVNASGGAITLAGTSKIIKNGTGATDLKITSNVNGNNFAQFILNGSYTIGSGSIEVTNAVLTGDNTVIVRNGEVKISGSINGNLTIVGDTSSNGSASDVNVVFNDFTVSGGAKLTLNDSFSRIENGTTKTFDITYQVGPGAAATQTEPVDISNFYLYGDIVTADGSGNVTIEVQSYSNFQAFSGANIQQSVTIQIADRATNVTLNLGDSMETVRIGDDVVSSNTYSQMQTVLIIDTLNLRPNTTTTIMGQLVIEEGVTLTVMNGARLIIDSDTAQMIVTGEIEIENGGIVEVRNGDEVTVTGSIVSDGTFNVNSTVNIQEGGSVLIDDGENSIIIVTKDLNVKAGGELQIRGDMTVVGINNEGTVILNGANLKTQNSEITMAANNAVVDIRSFTADKGLDLTITDDGLVLEKDGNTIVHQVGVPNTAYAGPNSIVFYGNDTYDGVGVRGVTITEVVTSERDAELDDIVYDYGMNIAGTVTVVDDSTPVNNAEFDGTYTVDLNGVDMRVAAETTFTLGTKVTLNNAQTLNVAGNLVAVNTDSKITNDTNGVINVTGTIEVLADEEIDSGVINAAHYEADVNNVTHCYYTTLNTAVANGATEIDVMGTIEITESLDIPTGVTVRADGSAIILIGDEDSRDVVVSVADGASIRNFSSGGYIEVFGTLEFDNSKDNRSNRIVSDVSVENEPGISFTNIYTALNDAASGETVTITRDTATDGAVVLNADIEVKEGVTLVIPNSRTLQVDNDVTLTVNGTVQMLGTITSEGGYDGFNPKDANGEDKDEYSSIVVNGAFMAMSSIPYAVDAANQTYGYYIAGAYYNIVNTTGNWWYVTPVEQAATVSNEVANGSIIINGDNEVADVDFTGDDVTPVVVVLNGDASLVAGSVSLNTASITVLGQFDGTIDTAVGAVDFVNVCCFVVADTTDADDNQIMVFVGMPIKADADGADSAVTIASGNVTVTGDVLDIAETIIIDDITYTGVEEFAIAEGATLTVTGQGAYLYATDLTVDGTLVSTDNGTVAVYGILTVKGTFTVAAENTDNKTAAGKADIDTLYVGISGEVEDGVVYYSDATAATVNAANLGRNLSVVVVSAESTITGEAIENVDYTEFYLEDTLWITIYSNNLTYAFAGANDTIDYRIQPGDLSESEFIAWNGTDGKNVPAGTKIGDVNYEQVYAEINYEVYQVYVIVDNSIGSVAIDGQLLVATPNGYYALPNYGKLDAGQHTITYTLAAGYEGTATLASNGANVTVSGTIFTLSGDYQGSNSQPIDNYLTLGGASYTGSTVVVDGGNGGSGEMGLTDYLLIILVILIVVMAIMVAMRLMRS